MPENDDTYSMAVTSLRQGVGFLGRRFLQHVN